MVQAQKDLSTPAGTQLIGYEVRDGIAVLTLNDPPANTYS
jgi:enoyl-CoA hydratase/carnithine racemase